MKLLASELESGRAPSLGAGPGAGLCNTLAPALDDRIIVWISTSDVGSEARWQGFARAVCHKVAAHAKCVSSWE